MKKRAVLSCILLLACLAIVSSQTITASNISIKENYSIGETISGTFKIGLSEVNPNSFLTTSEGHSISLREFLKNNQKTLACESYNCENKYETASSSFETQRIPLESGQNKTIGIKLTESPTSLNDLRLELGLNFQEQSSLPLKITFADLEIWRYPNESSTFTRYESYGCFNVSAQTNTKVIGTTRYCEKMTAVPSTKKVLLGANFTGTGNSNLIMTLNKNNEEVGRCNFTASSSNYCISNLEEEITPGTYYVCVESLQNTNLLIGFENQGEKCGYYGPLTGTPEGDYSIFLKVPKYSGIQGNVVITGSTEFATAYLQKYYKSNCSEGCIIPLSFSGVTQEINLISSSLGYESSTGESSERKLYNITKIPLKINFSDQVNIEKANFKIDFSQNKNISFYLDSTLLLKTQIRVTDVPIIRNVFPNILPAGIPTLFVADYSSKEKINSYHWNFGDDTIDITNVSTATHIYTNISDYILTLKITNNKSQTTEKNFTITTVSPKDYLNKTLQLKKENLEKIEEELQNLQIPFKEKIKQELNITAKQEEIVKIESERKTATTEEKFLQLALRLSLLDIPRKIWIEESIEEPFVTDYSKIDLKTISAIVGKTLSDENYKKYIANWELQNVQGKKEKITLTFTDENGLNIHLAKIYKIKAKVEKDKAYLVFQDPIRIESSAQLTQKESSKIIELTPGEEKYLEVISFGEPDLLIYATLDPKNIKIVENITSCNFNLLCEKKLGEDYKNCRHDCKPWPYVIFLWILIIVLFGVAYTFVQIQFKRKYELELFKSQQELLNLVESINNSKENKISEKEITDKLIKKGWSKEQVQYAIKKSKGERTRPYEIIPVDKIMMQFKKEKPVQNKTNEGVKNEKFFQKTKR